MKNENEFFVGKIGTGKKASLLNPMAEQTPPNISKELEETMTKLAEVNKRTGFKAREIEVDSDGAMILDARNPHDLEWWENK